MTKVAIFVPIYLEGVDPVGNERFARTVRWFDYMYNSGISNYLHFDDMIVSDNGSSAEKKAQLKRLFPNLRWIEHEVSLTKLGDKHHDYPYCWRALYDYADVCKSGAYRKVYKFDTDAFILSGRLAEFLHCLNTGWTAMGLKRPKGFPADEFSVIIDDSFHLLTTFCQGDFMQHHGKVFERSLPFTHIERNFIVGRFGTDRKPPQQSVLMDAYGQAPLTIDLKFGGIRGRNLT
jgi:hypothetical protein